MKTCGKVNTDILSCDSVFFPVTGGEYNIVCGRIRAYQDGVADATTIDGPYVAGVSPTHVSPRQHMYIWTFSAGISEVEPTRNDACPCDATSVIAFHHL